MELTQQEKWKLDKLIAMGLSREEALAWIEEDRARAALFERWAEFWDKAKARIHHNVFEGRLGFWAAYELYGRLHRGVPEAVNAFGEPEEETDAARAWEALERLVRPWNYLPRELREEVEEWTRQKAQELREKITERDEELRETREWTAEFTDGVGIRHTVRIVGWAQVKWVENWDRLSIEVARDVRWGHKIFVDDRQVFHEGEEA